MKHFRTAIRGVLGISFALVGVLHFTHSQVFLSIMPPYLPWHLELVYLSGIFEIVGGMGLLFPATRTIARWGLIALLIAVYPANIHMLVNEVYIEGMLQQKWVLWARMPLQFLMAFGVYWSGSTHPQASLQQERVRLPVTNRSTTEERRKA